ncbi:MAG: ankyrin repeat domain-containing protein [Gemmatimonadaceae bacterium]|nr:ankyrin repeat domain-containing protein [Gemmatimonadaceae bacterium]
MPSRALIDAIKNGDVAAVKNLLATDATALDSREDPASPVLTAMYHGQNEIADYIAPRTELDVFEAAATGRTERLDELLSSDPEVTRQTSDGWTPLHLAAFFGKTDAARRLMEAGADLKTISGNTTANTPLHAAIAGRGDEELILRMLIAGADAGLATAEGHTPLHIAASRGNRRLCDLLIQYRASPSARMKDGKTPADIAAERGHGDLADYLNTLK